MQIIVPFKKGIRSQPVATLGQIKKDAEAMHYALIENSFTPRMVKTNLALHHSQICTDPFNFFVVHPAAIGVKPNQMTLVINPEIIEKDRTTKTLVWEGCMSFPHKKDMALNRYDRIKVKYKIVNENLRLEEVEEWVEGIKAQIFQHECEHGLGQAIY